MKRAAMMAAAVTLALVPAVAAADAPAREVEALMREYTRLWSAKDVHAIWSRIYRMDAGSFRSEADLAAEFGRLKAQGYDRSELHSVDACLLTPTQALAVLRFTRLKADGGFMPPKDRASVYVVRRFPDGWRITALLPMSPTARLSCTSAAEASASTPPPSSGPR